MKVVTTQEMVNIFLNQSKKNCQTIGLKTRKIADVNKKSRTTSKSLLEEFGTTKIIQESKNVAQVNVDYENSVNNRLEKAGEERTFESKPRTWGQYVNDSNSIVLHKGQHYLHVFQTNSKLGKETKYFREDGTELSETDVENLKANFLKLKPEEIKSQGLSYEESSKPTDYSFENITEITLDGEKYSVR